MVSTEGTKIGATDVTVTDYILYIHEDKIAGPFLVLLGVTGSESVRGTPRDIPAVLGVRLFSISSCVSSINFV